MTFKVTRIFRHFVNGVPQISPFPDEATDPPTGASPMEIRIKHFTEIENFTFLGYALAHELQSMPGGHKLEVVSTVQNLTVSDPEIQAKIDDVKDIAINNERLADFILDIGLNWEHEVASFNNLIDPADPLKVTDPVIQGLIDSLDDLTEALIAEVNLRAMALHAKH